jgi:hypothetical protein
MQALVSVALALSIVWAPPPADPRAIAPEANMPDMSEPASASPPAPSVEEPPQGESREDPEAPTKTTSEDVGAAPGKDARKGCFRTRGQCRRLSIMGIVFAGIGTAAVATGIGLMQMPNEAIADEPAYELSYEPPGVVSIGMGIGVLVTGVLMIIAGQRAYKLGLDAKQVRRPALGGRRWTRN